MSLTPRNNKDDKNKVVCDIILYMLESLYIIIGSSNFISLNFRNFFIFPPTDLQKTFQTKNC